VGVDDNISLYIGLNGEKVLGKMACRWKGLPCLCFLLQNFPQHFIYESQLFRYLCSSSAYMLVILNLELLAYTVHSFACPSAVIYSLLFEVLRQVYLDLYSFEIFEDETNGPSIL